MIVPYLGFNGNTEEAFEFYKQALGGTITNIQRFGDSPAGAQVPDEQKNKIMHIALEAPDNISLMGSDFGEFSGHTYNPGNNFSLSFHPDSQQKADELFNALSSGGTVNVPMSKAPWGDYFGMFTDKFGIKWMINHRAS